MKTTPKYEIGTQFMSRGKYPRLCTVVDIYITTNSKGEVVKLRYVTEHDMMGQKVTDYDVTETGVSMGLITA